MSLKRREFLALAAAVAAAPALAASRASRAVFEWAPVGKGLFATRGQTTGGNVLLIVGEGEAMLVDAKFAGLGPTLRREAAARAGEGAAITHLLNTHHHADHTGGNHAFTGDAQVLAHRRAERRIREQFDRYRQQIGQAAEHVRAALDGGEDPAALREARELADRSFEAADWAPTRTIEQDHQRLEIGQARVDVHHFGPGHTDNDLVVHLPEQNVLHTGDLLFHNMHPYFDPPGGATARGWIDSLEKTLELTDDTTIVIPGHGRIANRAAIEKQLAYLRQVRDAALLAVRQGKSREQFLQTDLEIFDGLQREQIKERALGAIYDEASAEE